MMHWEDEVVSGWEAVESFGIASQVDGEPLKGSPQGSGGTPPQEGPGPCHCPGHLTTWGLGAGLSGTETISEKRRVGSDTWCVGHGPPVPGPRG